MSKLILRSVDVVAGGYCAFVGVILVVGLWVKLCASGSAWAAHPEYHDTALDTFMFALWLVCTVWCGVRVNWRAA